LSSGGAERSIKRIAALSRSALVRHVQVTPQEVHHHRRHENGQRLAGNVVGKPDKFLPVPTGMIAVFGILPTFRKVGAGDGILSSMSIKGTLPKLILGVLLTVYVRFGYAQATADLRTWLDDRALQSIDKSDQFYYANVHPYLEEPVKKLVKRIPELKSMQPAPDQQALPMILEKTGKTIDDFFRNIVDLIAREKITQENLTTTEVGRAEGYSTPRDVGARTSESVQDDYLIVRTGKGVQQGIVEYRMDAKGNRSDEPDKCRLVLHMDG
jgi:hypothetical protein